MPTLLYVTLDGGKVITHPGQLTIIELLATQYHTTNEHGTPLPQAAIYLVTGPTPPETHEELLAVARVHHRELTKGNTLPQMKVHILRTQALFDSSIRDITLHQLKPSRCFCGDPNHERFLELIRYEPRPSQSTFTQVHPITLLQPEVIHTTSSGPSPESTSDTLLSE